MRKFKKILIWFFVGVYLLLISGFVATQKEKALCNRVEIVIADSLTKQFLKDSDITSLLSINNKLSLGIPVADVNTKEIENLVLGNSMVNSCNVYTTIDGKLHVEVWQREPIVRIIDSKGNNYYLDVDGSVISISKRFTPHLLVVNGHIKTPFNAKTVENIYNSKFEGKAKKLEEIHQLALYISKNEFWNAQIVQIYVDEKGEFEIIPRIGPHQILFGKIDDYEEKLEKLRVFYKEGLNNIGWNQYQQINLKYKDQIVCKKNY